MSGKRNMSVCRGHELANAISLFLPKKEWFVATSSKVAFQWSNMKVRNPVSTQLKELKK